MPIPKKEDGSPDWAEAFYRDPEGAMGTLAHSIKQEMRAEYQVETNRNKFWSNFFREYPDLEAEKEMVDTIIKANIAELDKMKIEDAMAHIAEIANQQIAVETKRRNARTGDYAVMRGGPGFEGPVPMPDEDQQTLGDLIRSRREARREMQGSVGLNRRQQSE